LKFNSKGKWTEKGKQLRAEVQMAELKAKILEATKKAGLEDELETEGKKVRVSKSLAVFFDFERFTDLGFDVSRELHRLMSNGGTHLFWLLMMMSKTKSLERRLKEMGWQKMELMKFH
jgi:hypothetical protein